MQNASAAYPPPAVIVRGFAPGWFAAVMGTGAFALATRLLGTVWPLLAPLAVALHYFNLLLFVVLAVPWLMRWIRYPDAALATLKHPVQASFYPTFSIAMLVIAAQFLGFAQNVELSLLFWWPGAILMFVFSFAVLMTMFTGAHVGIEHVTPAKFIPAVGLVVIPLAGGPLLGHVDGGLREVMLLINVVGLGAGSLLYLGLLALTLQRKYLSAPAFGILTPTVWIHLAPLGLIPASLLNLAEQLPFPVPAGMLWLLSLMFWAFGVWWLVMASLLTFTAYRRGVLPFAISWWGFTFPLAAFVSTSLRLGHLTGMVSVGVVGMAAWVLLAALWAITLAGTVRGVASGDLFRPHP